MRSLVARRAALALVLLSSARVAWAHEVRPAYLEISESAGGSYDLLWKVPALGDGRRLGLHLVLPESCSDARPPSAAVSAGAYTERSRVVCSDGLADGRIVVEGLAATLTDVLVRVERTDGSTQIARLTPDRPWFVVARTASAFDVVRTYLPLGIAHILTGLDHLLFVLGLLLLVDGFKSLVKTVSAFTVAHGLTLSLATLGVIAVPPAPVEAVIALSIVFVASEAARRHRGVTTLAQRQPWVVAFTFGLLHGLGFASRLHAAGLPTAHVPLALLLFSLGVEMGHLSFVAAVLACLWVLRRTSVSRSAWGRLVPAYGIGAVSMFWLIERVRSFW